MRNVVNVNVLILIILISSGPSSCLCSKPEECEISGDNELDVVPNVAEVIMKIF